jgi:membrane-bound lytic murein transglycosylase B
MLAMLLIAGSRPYLIQSSLRRRQSDGVSFAMISIRLSTLLLWLGIFAWPAFAEGLSPTETSRFGAFLEALWTDAKTKGITRATFDVAFAGITPDARVIGATRHQPEYGKPFGDYVNSIVSAANIAVGTRKASEWAATLDEIEKQYGADRWIIVAIWGMETSYGAQKDRWDIFRSLATLAYVQYRAPYFRNELLVALKILQEEQIPRDRMVSSWAGAMGQTQFMPSNFEAYAVDFSGHGQRDIWTNVPDVLASTANYFQAEGWTPGGPWGFEVVVPQGFDYRRSRGSFAEWSKLGVGRADGRQLPAAGKAILFFPSGAAGPAFLVTENFVVIKQYNNSDAYALAVAHLADRLHGGGPIRAAWPSDDRQLSLDARIALQHKLAELGYEVHDFEGHIDFDLRDAIRSMQLKFGMVSDGHPTAALLERLGVRVP